MASPLKRVPNDAEGNIAQKQLPFDVQAQRGTVDVVGVLPKDIVVDPNLTEGHPGYSDSGRSEIIARKSSPKHDE